MKTRHATLWAVLIASMVVATALGQFGGFGNDSLPGAGAQEFGDSRDQVNVEAVASQPKVAQGAATVVAIVFNHGKGWHTWTQPGNIPASTAEFSGAQRTTILPAKEAAGSFLVAPELIQWPANHTIKADVGDGPLDYAVFEGRAIAFVPVRILSTAPVGPAQLQLLVSFQSCDSSTCLRPVEDMPISIPIEIVAAGATDAPWSTVSPDFAGFDSKVFGALPSSVAIETSNHENQNQGNGRQTKQAAPVGAPAVASAASGLTGMLILALLSVLGGFVLNLTPCVLPIIPIKILTISQHAGSPGKSMMLGLWMAIGVVAFWAGIGIPAALFTSAADPSRIFGIWWLTTSIGVLIGLMGVGVMGLFQIQLPAAAYAVNPKADTAWGSFLFGVMTGVLGLPCFGFVAGALLAGAATLPPLMIVTIFTGIGVGMAAPYLILSANPKWVDRIPRTGPASELVKQVMGLLLLAAAAYFVGSGLIALVSDKPWLGRQLHWMIGATFAALAGLWLMIRTFQISPKPMPRIMFSIVGLVIGGLAIVYCVDSAGKAKETYIAQEAQRSNAGATYATGVWNNYSEEWFKKARGEGKVVVLDFTAEWCLTCKTLKAAVLNREPVHSALKKADVVLFTVDLTSNSAPGWDVLRSLGKTGIPMLAIYAPEGETPWMSNAYTPDQVIAALDDARTRSMAAKP